MQNITPLDFENFSKEETKLKERLGMKNEPENQLQEPSQLSVNNILAYSKSLSIRPSESMGTIENILN